MEKSLSQKLANNLSYYIGQDKRCISNVECYYSGKTINKETEGCFVGRLLLEEDRVKADIFFKENRSIDATVSGLVKYKKRIGIERPKIISDNVNLLDKFQALHDNCMNWNDEYRLTEIGKNLLKEIINNFKLDIKDFENILK